MATTEREWIAGPIAGRAVARGFATTVYVIARNPAHGTVLLGGIGPRGVSQMWSKEHPEMRDLHGYDDAEIVS